MMTDRYLKPLESLLDSVAIKFSIATTVVISNQVFNDILGMFDVSTMRISALFILIILDWVSGIIKAKKRGEPITSIGLRRTIIKCIEYSVFLISVIVLSNITDGLEWIRIWVFVYIASTEVKSIAENIFDGDERMKNMMTKLWKEFTDRGNPDAK